MTRIIGGAVGGRRLATRHGTATRPTSERVREALFSAIEAWCGSLDGLRFLDLYAGSGAVGLEAWSRGAGVVTLVEQDRKAADVITRNAATLGASRAKVMAASTAAVLRRSPSAPYDIVFLDPPYPLTSAEVSAALSALVNGEWLVPGALVIVERSIRGDDLVWPEGLVGDRCKKYGETVLWYGHASRSGAAAPEGSPDGPTPGQE